MDDAVGLLGAGAHDVEVGEPPRSGVGAGRLDGRGGGVGAGEGEHGVAVGEQLGDDGRADQAGAAGDEDVHVELRISDGTVVPSL